ncbi:hypothetical protein O6H91_20G075300 [Diphasiastrum complanatum]|uniref:Uncharacterized protein n=1 Tax=Diphasiastrum complanatum TaxID=34168 RepID=A0ACC2ARY3_DIPCM|nr:hypothetical protein O6H91_20G075300 [Diphasiastrum complanatum]
MKRRIHVHHKWRWRIGSLMLGVTLVFTVLRVLASFVAYDTPSDINRPVYATSKPKIAFLFLARNRMPLDFYWEHFFKGSKEDKYSVFIHARPGFVYNAETTECSSFYNHQLTNSILVQWGGASMIEAERILLARALEDHSNSYFVLLSDSCIPLYNFSYIYDYITSSSKSFVDSFRLSKEEQYNPAMAPVISKEHWRKGSQWFVLVRKHAEVVVADATIFPVFREHCQSAVLSNSLRDHVVMDMFFQNPHRRSKRDCIPDEHYIQTLLAIKGLEVEAERRTLTYTFWKEPARGQIKDRWHPVTFGATDASLRVIQEIQAIDFVNYETEGRKEWCSSNGVPRPCFLFARKFTRTAALRLLNESFNCAVKCSCHIWQW